MTTQFMMATKAVHNLGDISRDTEDLCIVSDEDAENYIGNWATGFGFVNVKFPKASTRPLTAEEVEHYHGMAFSIGDGTYFLNLKGEEFVKPIILTKNGQEVFKGNVMGPVSVGKFLYVIDPNTGKYYRTTTIQEMNGNTIKTRNSTYTITYL